MPSPDLKLMIDNSLFSYEEVKSLLSGLMDNNMEEGFEITSEDQPIKSAITNMYAGKQLNMTDADWEKFSNLYEIEGGKGTLKRYKGKRYSDLIYFPVKQSTVPNKSDIIRYKIAAGDPHVFEALKAESDEDILSAGGSLLEDETVNSIESFFELYDSKSSLMKSKVADISKWKNISNYDEFLQVPLLKEGKDFMSKFLDIQDTIEAGGEVDPEDLEGLIPSYMKGGLATAGKLSLLDAVDPNYSDSSYILGEGITDVAKELINRSFLHCFAIVRSTTLSDLKSVLSRLELLVKQINRRSDKLVRSTDKSVV